MTAIRKEIMEYIEFLPDSKLEALKPILCLLTDDTITIETNLTEDEKNIIQQGREEYKAGSFITLDV